MNEAPKVQLKDLYSDALLMIYEQSKEIEALQVCVRVSAAVYSKRLRQLQKLLKEAATFNEEISIDDLGKLKAKWLKAVEED